MAVQLRPDRSDKSPLSCPCFAAGVFCELGDSLTENPYIAAVATSTSPGQRRAVRQYVAVSCFAIAAGANVAIPGILLINQEWQLVPTDRFLTGFEVAGREISNTTVVVFSLAMAVLLMTAGAVSATLGFRNSRANHRREQMRSDIDQA